MIAVFADRNDISPLASSISLPSLSRRQVDALRMVADLTLDNQALKAIAAKEW